MGKLQGLLFGLATLTLVVVATYLFAAKSWLPHLVSDRGDIDTAMWWSLVVTGVVFIITNLLLGWFAFRYQAQEGVVAAYWHDNSRLEWTWTLVTAGIMLVFTVNALSLWAQVTGPAPADAVVIEVTGQQFAWNVRYPGPDGIFGRTDVNKVDTAAFNFIGLDRSDPNAVDDIMLQNQLFLPEGRPVRIRLRSLDVIHSFFLPNFRVKQDAMPGMTSETWFVPKQAGAFELACAEHCGLGHYRMKGAVTVVPAAELDQKLKEATAE
jgi:cytochrome c oxidase subunit 2